MSDPVIRVDRLGKCYRIRHQGGGHSEIHTSLRDVIRTYAPSPHLLDRMGTFILATGNGPSATIGRDLGR